SFGRPRRNVGSPPVSRTFSTPWSTNTRVTRVISSNERISRRSRNWYSRPKTSFGMQYVQRKLQRSVTEMRRSCNGRPSVSSTRPAGSWLLAPGSLFTFVFIQQFFQYLPRAGGSPGAVADDVLLVRRQLRHRCRLLRHPKDRVVAETSFTPRRLRDEAEDLPFGAANGTRPRVCDRDCAAEARPPPL